MHQKALFIAQQFQGFATAWRANYVASLPTNHQVQQEEFKAAFCAHFIPVGLMEQKFQEFLDLKQGGRTVLEYSQMINHLSQYATSYMDSEEKKRTAFKKGMNPKLREHLTWLIASTFNDLANTTIIQEDAIREVHEDDHKQKAPMGTPAGPPPKYRLVYTSPSGQHFHASPQQQYYRPPRQAYARPPQQP